MTLPSEMRDNPLSRSGSPLNIELSLVMTGEEELLSISPIASNRSLIALFAFKEEVQSSHIIGVESGQITGRSVRNSK